MIRLSVVLAVYNEEKTLRRCLESVKDIADEIVIVDGGSTDTTVSIAKLYGARIIETDNPAIFHINKQKALDAARGTWILQLDADEAVTKELAQEITSVIGMSAKEREQKIIHSLQKKRWFEQHQHLLIERDGAIGTQTGDVVAYFLPRQNYFLNHPIRRAGTYPDGVIRLCMKGKAHFPSKSVHEQIVIAGKVGWLEHDLLHYSNSTLQRYVVGANKYTSLLATELYKKHPEPSVREYIFYCVIKPIKYWIELAILHKGILDGIWGILFCTFSALHYPVAYSKYIRLWMSKQQNSTL